MIPPRGGVWLDRLRATGSPRVAAAARDRSLSQLGHRARAERGQIVGIAVDWVTAPVETQRLLLEAELIALGPRRRKR